MRDWDDDKEQLVENIQTELQALTSETEKAFILLEAMKNLDQSKMPPTMRQGFEEL